MENNMKRYLAMVEWHLRNLPEDKRVQIIKDIRYDMELRKIREGLTEDELILLMDSPRKMAVRYGGIDAPMPSSAIPPKDFDTAGEAETHGGTRRGTGQGAYVKQSRPFGPITPGSVLKAIFGVMAAIFAISLVPAVGAIALALVILGLVLPIVGTTGAALAIAAVMMTVLPGAAPLLRIVIFVIGINFIAKIIKRIWRAGKRSM